MRKRLILISCIMLIFTPDIRTYAQDEELEPYLHKAYTQKKKSHSKAFLMGLVPSVGHAYVGFDKWKNRGVFFLLGEAACITISQTLGYSTQKRSIGPGVYEEWENQPTFYLYSSIMAFTAFKIYELWDVNQQVTQYNQELQQRYDLTLSRSGSRTKLGMVLYY